MYDEDSDDEYDALKDAFDTGDSDRPMSGRQWQQYDDDRRQAAEERRYWGR